MAITTKSRKTTVISPQLLTDILQEIRLLRKEMMFLFPQEDLDEYSHPDRIKRSYNRAVKVHTPVISVWK